MYNKTIIEFGFRDIQNYQGHSKCYQLKPKAEVDNTYLAFDYSEYHQKPHPIIFYYYLVLNQ